MESRKSVGVSGLGLALLLGAQGAMAQVAVQPQAIPFGSFVLVPTLVSQTLFDDNIYGLSSDEVSSFAQILTPSLAFVAQDRLNVYTASYELEAASYANDSNDSYADQTFRLTAHMEPDSRLRFDGGLTYHMTHDARGTGSSTGIGLPAIQAMGEVDKYNVTGVNAGVEYGARDARGMAVASVGWAQKRYDREAVATSRDNDTLSSLIGLRARLMPKTTATLDFERVDTGFKNNDLTKGGTRDSLDTRILAGVTWDTTAQTSGKVRLGQGKREVDGAGNKTKFSWDLGVKWQPMAFDLFTLDAGSSLGDSNGDYVTLEGTTYNASWTHEWSDRFNTVVSLGKAKNDMVTDTALIANRTDDLKSYGLGANYQMRRWLVLTADVKVNDRSSDISKYEAKRSVMSVGAQISL